MKHVSLIVRVAVGGKDGLAPGWYVECGIGSEDGEVCFHDSELERAAGKAIADYIAKQGFADLRMRG